MLILVIFCQDIFVNIFNNVPFHFALLFTQMKTLHCFHIRILSEKERTVHFRSNNKCLYTWNRIFLCGVFWERSSHLKVLNGTNLTNLILTSSFLVGFCSSTVFLVFQVSIKGWKGTFSFKSQKLVFKVKKHKWPFFSISTPNFAVSCM